jgi:acetolactate synthase-1/3 small subunit
MSALNIKKGSSGHSAHDLQDFCAKVEEDNTLAVMVGNKPGVLTWVNGRLSGRGYGTQSLTLVEVNQGGQRIRTRLVASNASAAISSECDGSVW